MSLDKLASREIVAAWIVEQNTTTKRTIFEQYKDGIPINYFDEYDTSTISANFIESCVVTETNYVLWYEDIFPKQLLQYDGHPLIIFYRGDINILSQNLVGVVGARSVSSDAVSLMRRYIDPVINDSNTIITGGAVGIDTEISNIADNKKARVVWVLGGAVDEDTFYPNSNIILANRIIQNGGLILSEYPPFTKPTRYSFPLRNRLIAQLARILIVVQANISSGSLITANLALELGREVFTFPYSPLDTAFQGNNKLIANSANIIYQKEIAEKIFENKSTVVSSKNKHYITNLLVSTKLSFNQIQAKTNLTNSELIRELTLLELKGEISQDENANYLSTTS
jgi:DNA processing protein